MRVIAFILLMTIASGCRTAGSITSDDSVGSTPPVPWEAVRADFDAARELDRDLELGFYRAPWILDFPSDGDSVLSTNDRLLADLKADLSPESWSREGRRAFREDAWLVVFQTREVHAQLRPWLDAYAKRIVEEHDLVAAEIRLLRTTRGALADWQARLDADEVVSLEPDEVTELLEREHVQVVSAPRLVVWSGQRANVQVVNQYAYIEDYIVYHVDGRRLADPQVGVLKTGTRVDVRPELRDATIHLDLEASISDLVSMESAVVQIDDEQTLELEIPTVHTRALQTKINVAPGKWSLVPFQPSGEYLLIRCEKATLPE